MQTPIALAVLATLAIPAAFAQESTAPTPYDHKAVGIMNIPNCEDGQFLTKRYGVFICLKPGADTPSTTIPSDTTPPANDAKCHMEMKRDRQGNTQMLRVCS